jgi:hypothetical protein
MRCPGIEKRLRNAGEGSEMEHDINSGDRLATDRRITQIALQELDPAVERGNVAQSPCAEIVDDPNRVTERDETLSEMRADEPGATGD